MRCPSCQTSLPAGQRFCGRCGEDVRPGGTVAPSPAAAFDAFPQASLGGIPGSIALSGARLGQFAPWWRRAVALLLDGAVVTAGLLVLGLLVAAAVSPMGRAGAEVAIVAVQSAALLAYYTVGGGRPAGQTVGYRVMGMRVADLVGGGGIGYARAFLRMALRFALYGLPIAHLFDPRLLALHPLVLLLGTLPGLVSDAWPLVDPRRQTLVDKVARAGVYLQASR